MAKVITTIMDKQSGKTQFPNGEIIPHPVLNKSSSAVGNLSQKPKYVLLNADGKSVATLIDEVLAEKWVTYHKKGAVRFVKDSV